jgi:hypothetical protein
MKIVVRGGQPKFVKRFMVKRLDHSSATRGSARRVTNGNISSTIRFPSDLPSGETACTAGGKFSASR